ncbi:MAG: hypothetical protein NC079_00670 [Clostridium sp.]|nr:hypothetical protein [Acetatifactor muris]MCM1527450.1 hypothetical protein [Bacteroides sp.]MCM1562104.1 hypothetical protein [Clostridium sp.]
MATYSQYKNLELPAVSDRYDIQVFNKNNLIIDSELHKLDLKVDKVSEKELSINDLTPSFTQAATRENIKSGEKISILFGKIMKFLTDLKTVAFTGSYTDLSNRPTIPTRISQLSNDSGFKTTDTTYDIFVKSGSGAKAGLVPSPGTTAGTSKYLREDGTWQVPPYNNTQTLTGGKLTGDLSMDNHDITELRKIKSGNYEIDMEGSALLDIGTRTASGDWSSAVRIGDNDIKIFTDDHNRVNVSSNNVEISANQNISIRSGQQKSNGGSWIDLTADLSLSSPQDIDLHAAKSIEIAGGLEDKTYFYKSAEFRFAPGATTPTNAPASDKYVKTGNIQGIKLDNGEKPNISNFNRIGAVIFAGNLQGNADTATNATYDSGGYHIHDILVSLQNQINDINNRLGTQTTYSANGTTLYITPK